MAATARTSTFPGLFGNLTSILDRVIHRAHRIELKGDSLRKRHARAAPEALTTDKEK